MEQGPWEANSHSGSQAVLPFYRTQMYTSMFRSAYHWSPPSAKYRALYNIFKQASFYYELLVSAQQPSWRTNPCRLSKYIHSYSTYMKGDHLFHLQPEDVPYHAEMGPRPLKRKCWCKYTRTMNSNLANVLLQGNSQIKQITEVNILWKKVCSIWNNYNF
jgi:hypothetical protein